MIGGLADAPSANLPWQDTSLPHQDGARELIDIVHATFPCGSVLAPDPSPSFARRAMLPSETIASFQSETGVKGRSHPLVVLSGSHGSVRPSSQHRPPT